MVKSAKWLSKIAKHHKEWIKIVNTFGEYDYAEDIVQESYITLFKYTNENKIIKEGKVSKGYMYFTLRSMVYQYFKNKNKINKISIDNYDYTLQIPDKNNLDEQNAFHKICTMIDNHIDKWRWYEKKLFTLYRDSNMSIRKLARATNISWVSIFNTLKNAKSEIKLQFKEDWEDYINKDYDKL